MDMEYKVPVEESKINYKFYGKGGYKNCHWTLLDDRIIYHKKTFFSDEVNEYSLEDIKFHKYLPSLSGIQFFVGSDVITLTTKEDSKELREAVDYIKENCGVNKLRKLLNSIEWRMRCNVCGHVFCYTYADLEKNARFEQAAKTYTRGAVVNALVGTQMGMYEHMKLGNDAVGNITDYSRCPHCNSSSLTEITDEEQDASKGAENQPIQQVAPSSAADEIKKFKELLDCGIITQEEFDVKKKQLLGL